MTLKTVCRYRYKILGVSRNKKVHFQKFDLENENTFIRNYDRQMFIVNLLGFDKENQRSGVLILLVSAQPLVTAISERRRYDKTVVLVARNGKPLLLVFQIHLQARKLLP